MTQLREDMSSGVFVEVYDANGNTLGQAVYAPWQGRPLPRSGDTMACAVTSTCSGRRTVRHGLVRSRHFEVQQDEQGRPCVWVRLVVQETLPRTRAARRVRQPVQFSDN